MGNVVYRISVVFLLLQVIVRFGESYIHGSSLREKLRVLNSAVDIIKAERTMNSSNWPPAFCNDLQCPRYTVVDEKQDYEVRKYEATNWVSTAITGIDYDQASYTLFMRLFQYISGANVRKEKIDMTAPVLIRIIPGQGPACKDDFRMSFFISPSLTDPPQPTNPNVTLSSLPSQTTYVSTYPGFSDEGKVIAHAANLSASLQRDKVSYDTTYYFSAGYDAPFKVFNRHNEIWIIKN